MGSSENEQELVDDSDSDMPVMEKNLLCTLYFTKTACEPCVMLIRQNTEIRSMQIFVSTLTDTLTIEVEPTNVVQIIKDKIYEEEGIPLEYQRLVFADKELDDNKRLCDFNIENKSTIHLVPRVVGGYCPLDMQALAAEHLLLKKICRKCYGRLPIRATRCHKAKCGRTSNIRPKKCLSWVWNQPAQQTNNL